LSRAADGDAASWAEITDRFTRLLWSVGRSYRLCSEDCADVVQITWLRLMENLRRIDNPEALPGWLATTARREALNVLRRRPREVLLPEGDSCSRIADDIAPVIDVAFLEEERDAQLWRCFGQLPERDQRLLGVLIAGDRPSYAAVAAALDMPVGSIGPTRMRALKRLHDILATSGYPFRPLEAEDIRQT
jgi:RNA polymerase sigma factor (sigma-70 family)